jgi:phosphopantetheinyl transferase
MFVKVNIASIDQVDPDESVLSLDEKSRLQKSSNERVRSARLKSYSFARQVLGEHLNVEPRDLSIERTRLGQPLLRGAGRKTNYSVSHSGGLIAIAISDDCEVGLDIQKIEGFNPKVFDQILSSRENLQTRDRGVDTFFSTWTLKEAALKCVGSGLTIPMTALEVVHGTGPTDQILFIENRVPANTADSVRRMAGQILSTQRLPMSDGYAASLAWPSLAGDVLVKLIKT